MCKTLLEISPMSLTSLLQGVPQFRVLTERAGVQAQDGPRHRHPRPTKGFAVYVADSRPQGDQVFK